MDEKIEEHATSSSNSKANKQKDNKDKPGIIYLSTVSEYMSVQKLRNVFGEFGEVNRTFFQPVEKSYSYKKGLLFTEGWVEFSKKSVAKYVALALSNTQVGGKKRNPWFNCIWNIKYLPKFTWTDVNDTSSGNKGKQQRKTFGGSDENESIFCNESYIWFQ
ncbi:uncharacterized protein LOC131957341 [Physella acuta]|uniref:uncharacterized protein LOC131957341 n=1 Tax=Physella acuta TaxID=109671 RepID=UPI0027DC50A2|nr:uncharacterized protein LOC131957341 [Physella acuta]